MTEEKLQELLAGFTDAYIDFVKEQLAKHLPDDQFAHNAHALVLMHTAVTVAASLAGAVWSAQETARIAKAGSN